MSQASDNKRIAYNTIILYMKLILSVLLGLFTSRLVLLALGSSDYGLYSVVGGIVSLLNILGVTMVSTSYRYISVEIGKGVNGDPNKVYNTIFVIHLFLAFLLVLLGIVFGLWYVDNYLNVTPNKVSDAKFVLLVSLISTAGTIISVPCRGLIIAREKFLFTSIVESFQLILKLILILLWLQSYEGNKLRLFSEMMLIISLVPVLFYFGYCYIYDSDIIRWKFNTDRRDYSGISSFSGWMLLSTLSFMGLNQGMAMIINIFWGTVINASFSIANQVQNYIQMFPKNIIQASSPQIMKSYAEGNGDRALSLTYLSTKYCFFSLWLFAFPFLLFIDDILGIWLGSVPPYTAIFTSCILLSTIIGSLTNGFDSLILATGKIRWTQLMYLILNFSLLPVVYCSYYLGAPVYINVVLMVALNVVSVVCQTVIIIKISNFNFLHYLTYTIRPALSVVFFSMPLVLLRFLVVSNIAVISILFLFSCLWIMCGIYYAGITLDEKELLKENIIKYIRKEK